MARALEADILKSCVLSGASFAIITFHKKKTSFGFNRNPEQKYNSFSFDIEGLEFFLFSVTGI